MTLQDFENENEPVEEEPDLMNADAFLERRDKVYSQIHNDEEAFHKCIAEIYVFICTMEQGMRKMISSGGPLAMLSKVGGMKS